MNRARPIPSATARQPAVVAIAPAQRTDHAFVRELFNDTAPHYDLVNRIFSLGSGGWYRRRCLRRAGMRPGQTVLDVAIGTGLIAKSAQSLVGPTGMVLGLDLSEAMLIEARRKLDIPLVQGTAEALPFAAGAVDFLILGYAIRHLPDLAACFEEFHRVLRPGGTLLLLEVSAPRRAVFRGTIAHYLGAAVPRLSRWITREPKLRALMAYHWDTMEACVPPEAISRTMADTGFAAIVCETWFDMFRSYSGTKRSEK